MRRTLKLLHTLAAMGMGGALAASLVLLARAPGVDQPAAYLELRAHLAIIARQVLLPAAALCLVSGLLSIAVHRPFHNAGWAWFKALTGVLVFEGVLAGIDSPARRALEMLAGPAPLTQAALAEQLRHEWGALWIILGLSVLNVVLGVWRPKFTRRAAGRGLEREEDSTGTG